MTWAAFLANGFGSAEYRLEIEGWPYQFVTHPDMEQVLGDTRERIACLSREGFEWEESCDFVIPELDGSAPVVRFIQTHDDRRDLASILAKRPTPLLSVSNTASPSTSILAVDQDVFGEAWDPSAASSRYVHLGKEVIYATAVSATTGSAVLTCVRGRWGTDAHAHFAISYQAANASSPIISDYPYSMEGRWAKLFVYGEGDNPYGEGTQVWRGLVGHDARYDGDTGWSLQLEPTHEKLKEEMFTNAGETIEIRGINTHISLSFTDMTSSTRVFMEFWGAWETQEGFVADLSDALEAVRTNGSHSSWVGTGVGFSSIVDLGTSLSAANITALSAYEEDGSLAYTGGTVTETEVAGRWGIEATAAGGAQLFIESGYYIPSGTNDYAQSHNVDPLFAGNVVEIFNASTGAYVAINSSTGSGAHGNGTFRWVPDPAFDTGNIVSVSGTNVFQTPLPGAGRVPRHDANPSSPSSVADRLYVNKVPPVRTGAADILAARFEDASNSDVVTFSVLDVDANIGFVDGLGTSFTYATDRAWAKETLGAGSLQQSPLQATLCYGITNAAVAASTPDDPVALEYDEFFSALYGHSTSTSQDVLPPLYSGLLGSTWLTASPTEAWKKRQYQYTEPISFWDAASPVLFMHSLVPTYDANGELQLVAFGGYDRTPAKTISANDVLLPGTGAPPPTLERTGQHAALTYFKIEQNQNPYTDESIGPTVEVRNVRVIDTIGPKRKIEKNWTPFAGTREGTAIASVDTNYVPSHDDISTHLIPYFEVFGSGSYTITLPLPLKYFTFVIGDTVAINCYSLPDMNGNEGIDSTGAVTYAGIVTGRKVDLTRGFVVLTVVSDLLPYS